MYMYLVIWGLVGLGLRERCMHAYRDWTEPRTRLDALWCEGRVYARTYISSLGYAASAGRLGRSRYRMLICAERQQLAQLVPLSGFGTI